MNQAQAILQALGGWDNIRTIEACITRIRVEVAQDDIIDDAALREAGAFDVIKVASVVQVVVGPCADDIVKAVKALA